MWLASRFNFVGQWSHVCSTFPCLSCLVLIPAHLPILTCQFTCLLTCMLLGGCFLSITSGAAMSAMLFFFFLFRVSVNDRPEIGSWNKPGRCQQHLNKRTSSATRGLIPQWATVVYMAWRFYSIDRTSLPLVKLLPSLTACKRRGSAKPLTAVSSFLSSASVSLHLFSSSLPFICLSATLYPVVWR